MWIATPRLSQMDYQDDDDDVLAAEEGELPERPSEARPFVPKGLLQGAGAAEDEEGGDSGWHWSLRKAAAQALDLLCTVFDGERRRTGFRTSTISCVYSLVSSRCLTIEPNFVMTQTRCCPVPCPSFTGSSARARGTGRARKAPPWPWGPWLRGATTVRR